MASFPEEFHRIESGKLRLEDGSAFMDKKSSNGFEVICTSFGLVSTFLRRKVDVKEKLPVAFHKLKDFLNELDLNVTSTSFVEDINERPIAARRLEMAVTKSGTGTWDLGRGDSGTWGRGDVGTWGRGDSGTCELGDVGTHFYHLFNFSSYLTKSSFVDRNCVVPRFKFLVCMM